MPSPSEVQMSLGVLLKTLPPFNVSPDIER
jgi:hypothetical protein